ncbi:bifunctional enoyl-CoA hydratase/phosphate acetyltransferase [Helicobacter anatolicus]|uniref:bifunctional enoyl-CoA hydratase/phosphate acetyltransferase n=1 Tax=Helicobacter anatolicus TaxID=2905874 RepID=UPI001E47C687|nr:bifunctional enoyl-CoA hydratase/phosphate acetyltransferase [Helicobacter anatolicus]MCE3038714.1 bifunctional enoyl-CoA hydratase/phosphate acetyltransferase [Helicobacter anatolicus]
MKSDNLEAKKQQVFDEILERAKQKGAIKVAVAQPTDKNSLEGVIDSYQAGLIDPILVGDKEKIINCAKTLGFDISAFEIVDVPTDKEAATAAVEFATKGIAKALMKGNLHTNDIMSAVLKKEAGLRTDRSISHAFVMDIPTYHKALIIADSAINIAPNFDVKFSILQNSVILAKNLGIKTPKVAILSAVEMPYEKMPSSVEAFDLAKKANEEIKDVICYGPLAFDNAISEEAAKIKKINSPVCGDPDILIVPQIESGNILFKSLVYLAHAKVAGVVLGAKVPVILTSRADSPEARVSSSALAVLVSE